MSLSTPSTSPVPAHLRSRAPVWGLFALVLVFFFVSGACGLLYQVVWTRKLVLLFGTTSYAVSTVLSIFFLGLGFGSLWGGRLADRTQRPLFLYGVFEVIIGLWAIAFIFAVGFGEGVVVALLQWAGGAPRGVGVALRAIMAGLLLLVPVLLMGATLPLLAKYVSTELALRGRRIGALYSINTFGAVLGCAYTGFVLIAAYGYTRSTLLGAAANIAVGLVAVALSRGSRTASGALPVPEDAADAGGDTGLPRRAQYVVLAAFGLSGLAALALEVVWTRLLSIVFIGTTYAYTTMLTSMLCGIAVGSAVMAAWVDKRRHLVSLFGLLEVLIGLACLGMLAVFAALPDTFIAMQRDVGRQWEQTTRIMVYLSFAVLFVPTFLFGTTFPVVVRALTTGRNRLGSDVGRLYSVNTLGGVMGAVAGGFILIPALGTHGAITALAGVSIAVGVALILLCPTRRTGGKAALLATAAAGAAVVVPLMPQDVGLAVNNWFIPKDEHRIHYDEGVEGTVVVSEPVGNASGSDRVLWINGVQATASIERGVRMNRLQGVLPALFDRPLDHALFMCFGSGITAGTLGLFDYERIDAVEISRDVLEAAPLFAADNFNVTENPRFNFVVDDGRNFLLTTANTYDVITFEPMPLALAGVSTFYTQEYYRLCLARLRPGGLVSQWVPLHSLNPQVVKSLVYTFTTVFPEYSAFFINADLFLIGSDKPLQMDYAAAQARLSESEVKAALDAVELSDLPEVFAAFFMDKARVDAFAAGGTVMTDDLPWAEFVAPRLIYERTVQESLTELIPHYQSPVEVTAFDGLPQVEADAAREALDRRYRAHRVGLQGLKGYYGGFVGLEPAERFKEALEIDPNDYTAQYYLVQIVKAVAEAHLDWDEPAESVRVIEDAQRHLPLEPELLLLLGDAHHALGDPAAAATAYRQYLDLGGTEPRAAERATP